ncbi:MAG: DegV family protein [Clostridiales bacterium]|nr:DegV family protein [Clostridiales bacterium]
MSKYVIFTDTASDIPKEYREKYGIEYVKMSYNYDEKNYPADLDWEVHGSPKGFYDVMRNGTRIKTAQVSDNEYKTNFEKWLKDGYDILYIACSSAISASINGAIRVRNELDTLYPDRKIIIIDSLRGCGSIFFMSMEVSKLKANGATIEEAEKWVLDNRMKVHQLGTVADLKYLKQAGRVSATSAFFGGLFHVKPIIISDAKGQNFAIEKVKGRKQSLDRLISIFKSEYVPDTYPTVIISNADCEEDASYLKEQVLNFGVKEENIIISTIGPATGSSVGPGMISLYYYGPEVTVNKE